MKLINLILLLALLLTLVEGVSVSAVSRKKNKGRKNKKAKADEVLAVAAAEGAPAAGGDSPSGSGSGDGAGSAASAEAKAEAEADAARQTVQAQEEETRAADAILNGRPATAEQTKEADSVKAYLAEQSQCNNEMRLMPRRTAEEVARARGSVRSTDVIIPVPQGAVALAALLEFHGALVKAGCRIVDQWCAAGKCFFRTCFCVPVNAEAAKAALVQAEAKLKGTDAKLAVDATIVKEAEVQALDQGKNKKAKKLAKKEAAIGKKLAADKKVEKKLEKAEQKVDVAAAKSDPATACPPGYKEVPITLQPLCKKEVFTGVQGFEAPSTVQATNPYGFGALPPAANLQMFSGY